MLLNLTPDHLDRHESFEAYAAAKMRMFENQLERDAAVLNADDPEITQADARRGRTFTGSAGKSASRKGRSCVTTRLSFAPMAQRRWWRGATRFRCAASTILKTCWRPARQHTWRARLLRPLRAESRRFKAVEHRLEFVTRIGGVDFYNDSKATNVDATLKAVEAFLGPLLVILGGKDKGSPYTPLREPLRRRARAVILIGAAAEKIAADLADAVAIEHAGTLDRAVKLALERARPGDVVLLAPACSSFDQFENYEQRGRVFKQLVAQLEKQSAASASAQKG